MANTSALVNCLHKINTAEKRNKRQAIISPSSRLVISFLKVMQKHQYIGEFVEIDDRKCNKVIVYLKGRLNKCAVILPRNTISVDMFEKVAVNYLPSRHCGFVVIATVNGIIDHEEARGKHCGGRLLGYFY